MELFNKLFGNLLAFVYHCFDRIVIHGYLSWTLANFRTGKCAKCPRIRGARGYLIGPGRAQNRKKIRGSIQNAREMAVSEARKLAKVQLRWFAPTDWYFSPVFWHKGLSIS